MSEKPSHTGDRCKEAPVCGKRFHSASSLFIYVSVCVHERLRRQKKSRWRSHVSAQLWISDLDLLSVTFDGYLCCLISGFSCPENEKLTALISKWHLHYSPAEIGFFFSRTRAKKHFTDVVLRSVLRSVLKQEMIAASFDVILLSYRHHQFSAWNNQLLTFYRLLTESRNTIFCPLQCSSVKFNVHYDFL